MNFILAILPILLVLCLMLFLRWDGPQAGLAGWVCGLLIALLAFGLTWDVFWVSQLKGLLLTLNILAMLWPALFLYFLVDEVGGVNAIAMTLERTIADRGILLITLAWSFSALVEGVAGFGLPMAIVAPMLIALGVPPLAAVAAPAAGHSWAVTFGGMGIVYQVLTGVTKLDPVSLAPWTVATISMACLGCGFAAAAVLRQLKRWRAVLGIGLATTGVLAAAVLLGIPALGSFLAAAAGILAAVLISRRKNARLESQPPGPGNPPALRKALWAYGLVIGLVIFTSLIPPVKAALGSLVWTPLFPEVSTTTGVVTPAGAGQIFRPLLHQGLMLLISALVSYRIWRAQGDAPTGMWQAAFTLTTRAALPSSLAVVTMVGLSTMMEHTGMTLLLAQGMVAALGAFYPLVSPLVGILGAFATGSNTNSNVLFGMLQKNAGLLLGIRPEVLVAAQTAGGGLGSMLAPAKVIVGCSTTNQQRRVGDVLRQTIPLGIAVGLAVGLLALGLAWLV